jgi:hypothetical protein
VKSGVLFVFALVATVGAARESVPALERHWDESQLPATSYRSPYRSLVDLRPVSLTLTVHWQKVPVTTTMERLLRDPFLWRNMNFDDWDRVPSALRAAALERMVERYEPVLTEPNAWATTDTDLWDYVPQPIRAAVFQRMVSHWEAYYGLAERYALNPSDVRDTLNAVMMAESWFEHRAINVNAWGNRDLGLGGCSDRCRRVLTELSVGCEIDFVLAEQDYFNPWHASRALVTWFGLELVNAGGDLDLAVAAYHRGFHQATDERGEQYMKNVRRLRDKFFSGQSPSPTWDALQGWSRVTHLDVSRRSHSLVLLQKPGFARGWHASPE